MHIKEACISFLRGKSFSAEYSTTGKSGISRMNLDIEQMRFVLKKEWDSMLTKHVLPQHSHLMKI